LVFCSSLDPYRCEAGTDIERVTKKTNTQAKWKKNCEVENGEDNPGDEIADKLPNLFPIVPYSRKYRHRSSKKFQNFLLNLQLNAGR
jgi:hypothetical protein